MIRMAKINICLFGLVLISSLVTAEYSRKLFLSVYYESYCPDSKDFILKQLQPAMELLHSNIFLHLIPFGKSKSINNGAGGFECQHGPKECLGNIIQDCTLNFMYGISDVERLLYVACEMSTEAGTRGDLQCVEKTKIPVAMVKNCVNTQQGTNLQMYSEYLTKYVSPKFIPTVTVDGVFNQQLQVNAQIDLIGTLCSILTDIPACARRFNNIALNYVLSSPLER